MCVVGLGVIADRSCARWLLVSVCVRAEQILCLLLIALVWWLRGAVCGRTQAEAALNAKQREANFTAKSEGEELAELALKDADRKRRADAKKRAALDAAARPKEAAAGANDKEKQKSDVELAVLDKPAPFPSMASSRSMREVGAAGAEGEAPALRFRKPRAYGIQDESQMGGIVMRLESRLRASLLALAVLNQSWLWKSLFDVFSCAYHDDGTATLTLRPALSCRHPYDIISLLAYGVCLAMLLVPLSYLLNPYLSTRTTNDKDCVFLFVRRSSLPRFSDVAPLLSCVYAVHLTLAFNFDGPCVFAGRAHARVVSSGSAWAVAVGSWWPLRARLLSFVCLYFCSIAHAHLACPFACAATHSPACLRACDGWCVLWCVV